MEFKVTGMELENAIHIMELELQCYNASDDCGDCGECPYYTSPIQRAEAIEELLNVGRQERIRRENDLKLIREKVVLDYISAGNNLTKTAELIGISKATASRILKNAALNGRIPEGHPARNIQRIQIQKGITEWKQ